MVAHYFGITVFFNIQINKEKKTELNHFNHHEIEHFIESDNPGSTDSEVRKILTLHIPITEYDTLGSESDNDVGSRGMSQAKFRPQRSIRYN